MSLITFVVPCFNSQDYMEKCIDTLLSAKDRVEILIIDDGSSDKTAEIADAYEKKYEGVVKAIHQENKGHGGALNTGIKHASGKYLKVVDSDDWLDSNNLEIVLDRLEELIKQEETTPDMFITDFVYDKVGERHKKTMTYKHFLPVEKIFTWDESKNLPLGKYILMHSVIYKTSILKESNLKLPEHTFYVDNLFVFEPLTSVKKMYYMNIKLYHYFIGREDQSVHESVMIKRIDQQLLVNKTMINEFVHKEGRINSNCWKYMYNYLLIITAISSVLLTIEGSEVSFNKMNDLWDYIQLKDEYLYEKMRHSIVGVGVHFKPKKVKFFYHVAQKMYGFN